MNMLKYDLQLLLARGVHDAEILHFISRILTELSLLEDKINYLIGDDTV